MDGLGKGYSGVSAYGHFFRDHLGDLIHGFGMRLGHSISFFVEIFGVILVLKLAKSKGWTK